jgi:hypothetical protein
MDISKKAINGFFLPQLRIVRQALRSELKNPKAYKKLSGLA